MNEQTPFEQSRPIAPKPSASAPGAPQQPTAPAAAQPIAPGVARPLGVRLGRIPVAKVSPVLHGGAYPAKAVVGEEFPISARVFREGHDAVAASAILTSPSGAVRRVELRQVWPFGLDIFEAWVSLDEEGSWLFRVEGWSDRWKTFQHNAEIKLAAGIDTDLICQEGQHLFEEVARGADERAAATLRAAAAQLDPQASTATLWAAISDADVTAAMASYGPRDLVSPTPDYPILVERRRALFSSWYEFFPRSVGAEQRPDGSWASGTFDTAIERLEAAAAMGFDVVYLPPIHPIGAAFRKGRNNTLTPGDFDPGSPWAIGSADGGHDAIHPDLGGEQAFARFVARAKELKVEVALDLALQASPDHPWVQAHPEWFAHRADGTIAYAENPPKKYQDIYPINFDDDPAGIGAEVLRICRLWIERGVTIFRVDNPHTKPVVFWEWLIAAVHAKSPEIIFLAEAFTRPEMMAALGAVGFTQSYTYFTWRNTKAELEEYLEELSGDMASYYRPNFFVNTPDINPAFLQSGLPAAFSIRAILAATLSPSWGVYSGYELCESQPLKPGGEEYLDSEKYEYRLRQFDDQSNLVLEIKKLNAIRNAHPALQQLRRIVFHETSSNDLIAYHKRSGDDLIIVVCSLDPTRTVEGEVAFKTIPLGLGEHPILPGRDLLTEQDFTWQQRQYVRLTPDRPAHIFHVAL